MGLAAIMGPDRAIAWVVADLLPMVVVLLTSAAPALAQGGRGGARCASHTSRLSLVLRFSKQPRPARQLELLVGRELAYASTSI